MKTIKRINNEFRHIDPNETFFSFIDGAIRALKIVKAEVTYQWFGLKKFKTNVEVHIKIAGLEGVKVMTKQCSENFWGGIEFHRTIDSVKGIAFPSTSVCVGDCVYPINDNYHGIFYKWNGLKAVQVATCQSCTIDLITGEETYKDFPDDYYLTKEECENDNAIKVVLFDDEEPPVTNTSLEYEHEAIKGIIQGFGKKYGLKHVVFNEYISD